MNMTEHYPSVTVLGSTGSVGEQAIDVAIRNGVRVNALCANKNAARVEEQARRLGVAACAMSDEAAAKDLRLRLADTDIKVYSGMDGVCEMISLPFSEDEVVVNSVIGEAGLRPTLAVLQAGKKLALANKESLVCAGTHHTQGPNSTIKCGLSPCSIAEIFNEPSLVVGP